MTARRRLTTTTDHECYPYVFRVGSWAWNCSCGARSDRANHATRQAAIDDWATSHRGET